ncbi:MAG: YlxR family protein [Actinomycetota bacterium]
MARPERTCAGCGRRRPQDRLVRLAVGASGAVEVGARGGRGTYLCPDPACVRRALERRSIPRLLCSAAPLPDDLAARVASMLAEGPNPADC